ncbi:helix-turn-helix domain-containing protein [Mumia zhuanghuii]|uniref:GlxA family transcriptional regulator n=2 Tax=Mumia TaxID=1546255 RepID=A0ABW1QQY8_9ACTN|nr:MULTISPECIES: helix-turn-helix domain-containing protein [Mumia]KAA1423898.1 helix-turn-helix domain-containing protein [Mumia zhuanghuii]
MTEEPLRVGVLAYPGCFASEVFGVLDLLTIGGHVARAKGTGTTPFTTSVMSPRRRVVATGDVPIGVRPMREVDVLVVPGFELVPSVDLDARLADVGPEIAAITRHTDGGRAVVSICVGAFLLGAAGLLDDRRATTSWLFADALARRFPRTVVTPGDLVVNDAGVTTTAGFSAMYDFVLDLVRRHCGPTAARHTARIALVDDARSSQAPYVDDRLLPATGGSFSARVERWLDQHLDTPYDLPGLAATFHTSTRTLLRRFKADTGETPLGYLQRARVRRAQHLLARTDRTAQQVARDVGYRDAATFSRLFARHVGIGPGAYRATFSARAPGAADPRSP